MNVLIMANKPDGKSYQNILKSAPNTSVLGVVNTLNSKLLSNIKSRYNPHILLIDESVNIPKQDKLSSYLTDLKEVYPHCQIILFSEHKPLYDGLGLYAIISGTITNLELVELIENAPVNNTEHSYVSTNYYSNKEKVSHNIEKTPKQKKTYKYSKKIDKKYIISGIAFIIVIIMFILLGIIFNNSSDNNKIATKDEAITTTSSVITTTSKSTTTATISTTIPTTTTVITTTKPTITTTKNTTTATTENYTAINKTYDNYSDADTYTPKKPIKRIETQTTIPPSTAYIPPPTKTKN